MVVVMVNVIDCKAMCEKYGLTTWLHACLIHRCPR